MRFRVLPGERCAATISTPRKKPHPKTGAYWNPTRQCRELAVRAEAYHGDGEIYYYRHDDNVVKWPRVALCEKHADATFGKKEEK